MLTREFADKLLAAAGQPSLAKLEKQIDAGPEAALARAQGLDLAGRDRRSIANEIETKNVVGVLEGAGPHAEETVVIGGHYDHLGHGGMISGSLAILSQDIHNGADDNASGTSMVLELARRLGARRDPLPRRVVFIAFSGEERGLLGSQYYVEHPLFPLSSTVMMINCDMVGRLNDKNELTMIGTGTTPGIDALVDVLGKSAGLKIKKVAGMTDGFGGSDHQSFYAKSIPVLFAFTGVHRDYHRPSDDSDRINFAGMARIADYLELITARRRPAPRAAGVRPDRPNGDDTPRRGPRPEGHVGLPRHRCPTTATTSEDGLKIPGVSEGSPAEKGGLKGGDVIIGWATSRSARSTTTWRASARTSPATRSTSWSSATARTSSSRSRWEAGRAVESESPEELGPRAASHDAGFSPLCASWAIVSGCGPLSRGSHWLSRRAGRRPSGFGSNPNSPGGSISTRPRPHRVRIDWLILAPGDDLETLAARRHPPDVLLGGPARSYERLTIAKRLSPSPIDGSRAWAAGAKNAIEANAPRPRFAAYPSTTRETTRSRWPGPRPSSRGVIAVRAMPGSSRPPGRHPYPVEHGRNDLAAGTRPGKCRMLPTRPRFPGSRASPSRPTDVTRIRPRCSCIS